MPILKQQLAPPAMKEAIVLDLGDLGAQAEKVREQARREAESILEDARRQAEQIALDSQHQADQRGHAEGLERGLAEGREQGKQDALAQAQAQLDQLTNTWTAVADDWQQRRTAMQLDAREAVLGFALRVAQRVVHRVIELDDDTARRQVEAALESVLSNHDVSVRIHPDDRRSVEDALPKLVVHLGELSNVTLVDDLAIGRGGCVLSCGGGEVDATVETQLTRIAELILPGAQVPDHAKTPSPQDAKEDQERPADEETNTAEAE